VPGMPSGPGEICTTEIRGIQSVLPDAEESTGAGPKACEGIQDSKFAELFDVPPVKTER
jgi:hypothetical protein